MTTKLDHFKTTFEKEFEDSTALQIMAYAVALRGLPKCAMCVECFYI